MSDALTPLRRAYGVDAPGSDLPAHPETTLLRQTRAAVEAAVALQDRAPSADVRASVLAEAQRCSAEALAPLAAIRSLYGEAALDAAEVTEAAILSQTRAAVERAVDARPERPSAEALAAVAAYAAGATQNAPSPDAPVEASVLAPLAVAYGLPMRASVTPTAETTLLVQTRTLLDAAPASAVSDASVSRVLARAAEASRAASAPPEAAVEAPALAALAVAYGLPTAGIADPAEAALLSQTRALLDAAPPAGAPSEPVLAAVLAHAAEASVATPSPISPAPDRPAPDRTPVRAARSYRRVGAWASAAALALALIVALLPDSAGAPELVAAQVPSVVDEIVDTPDVEPTSTEPASTPDAVRGATNTEALGLASPPAPAPNLAAAVALRASAPVAVSPAPRPSISREAASQPAVEPRPAAPVEARTEPAVRVADPVLTLASAKTSPAASWEAGDDVRVLSLRLQELRRGNEGLSWDAPVEAFGAPTTRTSLTTPALQNVRTAVPPARARLRTDPAFGDR